MDFIVVTPESGEHNTYKNDTVADFLFTHLEQYGDKKEDILKCMAYALNAQKGGLILLGILDDALVGAVVINKTGMDGYIPANILVYIAVDGAVRGKGIGKQLIEKIKILTQGGIALHVEPDNPAKKLYERLGFTNKYLEMRYVHE